jgi:low affinity Fe/Cu permease
MKEFFRQCSARAADTVGSPWAFVVGLIAVLLWVAAGPPFHYSDTWQLIVNSGSSIVTFLVVFLIQNTRNRDARPTQIKLNELIRAVSTARKFMVDLETLPEEEVEAFRKEFEELSAKLGVKKKGQTTI